VVGEERSPMRGRQPVALEFDSRLWGSRKEDGQKEDVGAAALLVADAQCCATMAEVLYAWDKKGESTSRGLVR
jgi:hypothetical protein